MRHLAPVRNQIASRFVIGTVGFFSKLLFKFAGCQLTVFNQQQLMTAINSKRPLISVSNHSSVWDDPVLFAAMLPMSVMICDRMRWAFGANDILFTNSICDVFFRHGRVLKVYRSRRDKIGGLEQQAITDAIALLNRRSWVHVFPEGKVVPGSELGPLRWGVAEMILKSSKPPSLLPFVHLGMDRFKPIDSSLFRFGQKVSVKFGDIIDTEPWRRQSFGSVSDHRVDIINRIRDSLLKLY